MRALFRTAIVAIAAAFVAAMLDVGASGCAAILHADTPGEHCGFQSNGTACGKCLSANCASSIDACCSDDSCLKGSGSSSKAWMVLVDECAGGNQTSCASVSDSSRSSGVEGAVAACVAARCSASCPGAQAGDGTDGGSTDGGGSAPDNCVKVGTQGCLCPSVDPTGPDCSAATAGGRSGICVKGNDACRCDSLLCGPTHGDNCACSTDPENDLPQPGKTNYDCSRASAGGRCCVYAVRFTGTLICVCGPDQPSCSDGQISVSECSPAAISSALGAASVDRCSR